MKQHYRKVFAVDDDPDDRELIREAFEEANPANTVLELLPNGELLLETLRNASREEYPSLILLDLNMPGKDGKSILTELKSSELFAHIPVIVLTTSSSEKDRDNCYDYGANCFVTKPSQFNQMVDLIRSLAFLWLPQRVYF